MAAIPLARPHAAAAQPKTEAAQPEPAAVAAEPKPALAPVRITIGDSSYSPSTLSVPKGTLVTWSQDGKLPHTVTADDGAFKSQVLRTSATFEHTFETPGTYLYFCELHGGPGGSGMSAEITVER